jgi:hypothetical protein
LIFQIDPILTPTGKKLQDGTRAVARQISVDILPALAASLRSQELPRKIVEEFPSVAPKIGGSIFDAISTQAKKQLELLQGDLQDPTRIPERLTKQTNYVLTEARNVFLETPVGLAEPEYKVVGKGIDYEIREYEGYKAAVTSMTKIGERFSMEDVTSGGAAFNSIASYLFGANSEKQTMEMTTPVTTTSAGEMRFFLKDDRGSGPFPEPMAQEDTLNEKGAVKLIDVTPARLAVARFTGFVTDGEVARQKDALMASLALDDVELDVPHGAVVPYFVFQYNPPYTIPIVRRNEIAIPVRAPGDATSELVDEWQPGQEESPGKPSDS